MELLLDPSVKGFYTKHNLEGVIALSDPNKTFTTEDSDQFSKLFTMNNNCQVKGFNTHLSVNISLLNHFQQTEHIDKILTIQSNISARLQNLEKNAGLVLDPTNPEFYVSNNLSRILDTKVLEDIKLSVILQNLKTNNTRLTTEYFSMIEKNKIIADPGSDESFLFIQLCVTLIRYEKLTARYRASDTESFV